MKKSDKIVKFKDWDCEVHYSEYNKGVPAIMLLEVGTLERIATASVFLIDKPKPSKNWTYIKEYSENEGMTQALIDAGVISESIVPDTIGYGAIVNLSLILDELT